MSAMFAHTLVMKAIKPKTPLSVAIIMVVTVEIDGVDYTIPMLIIPVSLSFIKNNKRKRRKYSFCKQKCPVFKPTGDVMVIFSTVAREQGEKRFGCAQGVPSRVIIWVESESKFLVTIRSISGFSEVKNVRVQFHNNPDIPSFHRVNLTISTLVTPPLHPNQWESQDEVQITQTVRVRDMSDCLRRYGFMHDPSQRPEQEKKEEEQVQPKRRRKVVASPPQAESVAPFPSNLHSPQFDQCLFDIPLGGGGGDGSSCKLNPVDPDKFEPLLPDQSLLSAQLWGNSSPRLQDDQFLHGFWDDVEPLLQNDQFVPGFWDDVEPLLLDSKLW